METTELEAKVYEALSTNEELMSLLGRNQDSVPIYHLVAPAGNSLRYPILVYAPTRDVPVEYGDDEEAFHKVTIRISVVTTNGEYSEINKLIRRVMTRELEFERVNTYPAVDFEYDKVILNCEYEKTIES